jgi:membrane-associated protease RseP (regulator of RpoE activity)
MQHVATPSGRPEIDIRIDKKTAMDAIANLYSRGGYTIKTVNEYSLVVEKPEDSMGAALLFGSRFATTPNSRVSLNFSEFGGTTHIQGRVEMVTNPGSGYENVSDLSGNATALQQTLVQAKALMEGGVIGFQIDHGLNVTEVIPNSPAESAGIRRGDKLLKIAGTLVFLYEDASKLLLGEADSDITITMSRDGTKTDYTVRRKKWMDVYGKKS